MTTQTFPEAYDSEIERVEELLREYQQLPAASGWFGVSMLKIELDNAKKARRNQDVVEMLRCYASLQTCE